MKRPRFTAVPNEFIDLHLPELSSAEVKVALVIMRLTYGWNRDLGTVSLSRLSELTGLAKSTCCEAGKSLVEKGLIKIQSNSSDDGGCSANTYEMDFEETVAPVQNSYNPVLSTERPPFAPPNGIRNKEIQTIQDNKITPLPPPPQRPAYQANAMGEEFIPAEEMLAKWGNYPGFKKPRSNIQRRDLLRLFSQIEMTAEDYDLALRGYHGSEWARENGYPVYAFAKDPAKWIRDFPDDEYSTPPPAAGPILTNEQKGIGF